MSETCTHDCSSCKSNCDHRAPQHEPPHARSRIQKVIGVVSGKGGVGKSMTSAMLAVSMRRLGFKAGVLDADITGPSIPRLFGVKGPATGDGESINPVSSRTGVEIMSINLLLDDPEAPVVWRGPVIAGAVKQFWQEVVWDVDFLFVDMPPGTGDVPLTVFQTLPVDGIVIVSSPQELVGMIVGKAVQMAQMMHVPILGLVENMSYAVCPDCGKHINVFGDSHVDEIADKYKLPVLAKMTPNITDMTVPAVAAVRAGADGLAAINTIKSITGIDEETMQAHPGVMGKTAVSGYSGKAVKPIALRHIYDMAVCPELNGVPISGMGGIETWRDAVQFLALGCSNIQITTAVMQYGYRIITDLIGGLTDYMNRHGIASLRELVGAGLEAVTAPEKLNRSSICYPKFLRQDCSGCGRCYISCMDAGHQAIRFDTEKRRPSLIGKKCVGCLLCTLVCPVGAVTAGTRRSTETPEER